MAGAGDLRRAGDGERCNRRVVAVAANPKAAVFAFSVFPQFLPPPA
jgi:threonine/homoserine/homoserine lactone efflux protein